MNNMKISFIFIILLVLGLCFRCKNDSDEINTNLARLNNKSWQLSRIIDSLENINRKIYSNIFSDQEDNNEKLDLLENYIKKNESNRLTWIQFQERDLVIDSLNNYRATLLDTINIYVDKYSLLHPKEKLVLQK